MSKSPKDHLSKLKPVPKFTDRYEIDDVDTLQLTHKPGRGRPQSQLSVTHWVRRLLMQPSQIKGVLRIKLVANKIVRAAESGEPWAVQALWDRVDGKVKEELALRTPPQIIIQSNVQVVIPGQAPGAVLTSTSEALQVVGGHEADTRINDDNQ